MGIVVQRESFWLSILIIAMAWIVPKGSRIAVILFAAMGALMAMFSQVKNEIPYNSTVDIIVRVDQEPVTRDRWQRTQGRVIGFKDSTGVWSNSKQRVQIYIDTLSPIIQGNTLYLSTKQRTVFDFYHRQGITGRIHGYDPTILKSDTTTVEHLMSIRRNLAERITRIDTTQSNIALMQALTLGERSGLNREQRTAYNRTGAAHLLAVSGLHVGIIYIVLFYLLGWIRLLPSGLTYFSILIIIMLWLYAGITGFSPSVLRAVVMFTLYQIGVGLSRESNNLNTLFAAGLILLLCNPNYLYDVGFQLSFVAMFGIILLYKPLFALSCNRIWRIVAVTLAAQVAVMPLSTYYFGTIPLFGIVTNLALWLVVPVIIVSTALYLATGFEFTGSIASYTANLQNDLVDWGASHSWIAIEDVVMPFWVMLLIYGVEVLLLYLFRRRLGFDNVALSS